MSAPAINPGVTPVQLAAAMRHCREITRHRARNFYYGLKLSPEPHRTALFVIYAWMRCADDLVDGAQATSIAAVQQQIGNFRADTDAALAGKPRRDDPLWIALADVASRFRLTEEHFHGMLAGQIDDLTRAQYQSFEQLHRYCYRVASTVGLLCIQIWGYEDERARELAIERGIAFQLTNIIRDFKQDYDSGRVYLPSADFEAHELKPSELRNWSSPDRCHAFMKREIGRAETYYRRSAGLEELINPCCRPTLWAMTSIYHELLKKMNRDPSRLVLGKRVRLSAMHKGTIAVRAKWLARAARSRTQNNGQGVPSLSRGVSGNTTLG